MDVKAGMLWLVGFDKRSIVQTLDTFGQSATREFKCDETTGLSEAKHIREF